jgi:hypothetical protein
VYKKVADSDDVVIRKQGFSTVGIRVPGIAISLSHLCLYIMDPYSYRGQIFLAERHQGVRRFVSPGLRHITPVSSHCRMSRNERHTSSFSGLFPPSLATILCHQQSPERRSIGIDIQGRLVNGGEAKAVLEYGGEIL